MSGSTGHRKTCQESQTLRKFKRPCNTISKNKQKFGKDFLLHRTGKKQAEYRGISTRHWGQESPELTPVLHIKSSAWNITDAEPMVPVSMTFDGRCTRGDCWWPMSITWWEEWSWDDGLISLLYRPWNEWLEQNLGVVWFFLNFAVLQEITLSFVQELAGLVTIYPVSNMLVSPPQKSERFKIGYKQVQCV